MAPSSASLTTFFVVGPEEYVEFAESMGSKAFLQHIWDNSVTPLTRQELDSNSRLHNTGARIVRPENGPPRIEFPTVKRLRGNRYKPTGKWISWQALKRLNPLAVTDPPDLNIFMARGGTVGSGERRAPGAYLEQTTSKNLIPFAVPEEPVASNTNLDEGMESQSYAPAPNGDDAAMPIPAGAATPPRPRTNKPSLNVNSQGWIGIGSAQSIHAPPRAVVVRRARQTSSPAALAAKAALAAGRPGPSPLANSVAGSNATVTPANAHILRSAAAAAGGNSGSGSGSGTAPSSPSAASTSASVTPVSTPPARSSSRFSHGTSASVSGISAYTTPPPSSSALGPRSGSPHGSLSTPPPSGSYQPSTPGSAGSAGSGSSRASRRPNLRVPMPPPPQHLSSSFRNAGGSGSGSGGGASASTTTGGPAVGGGLGAGSAAPPASSASGTTALTPGALTPGYASGARTPLSATHPPPETPLKHQRRRAKETAAALATAAAVVAGGTETSSGSGSGTGIGIGIGNRKGARTSGTEIAAGAATGTLSGSRAKDSSSGDGYVDADDERDPMDFAPTAGNAAAAVTRDGPSSSAMSPGSSANGGIGGGRSPMGSATHLAGLAHSSLGLGLSGPAGGGGGGGTPDLRALSNLNRADVERTRLAFERTAAGQDPLLSASANARSGAGGPVASPFSSGWSPAGGPASALMAAGGSGGAGPMAPPGSMFGSWAGLGDWAMGGASQQQQQQQQQQSNAHVAATAAAMVAAIAEARRSSLPPLTPATEGMPYPGAMGLPPVRTPNTTYDEEGPSGIGLGLETGPPVGRPSRPSIYGSFLETPPNGAVASSSSLLSSSLLEAKPRLSPSSLVSPSLVFPPAVGSRSSRRNGNGSGGERSRDTSTGSGGSAAGCREGLSAEGGGGGGGGSSSSDDLDGDGDGSAAGSGISLNCQGSDQGSLASSFQFVRLGGAGPGPSSTAVLAQASPSSTTVTQNVLSAVAEPEPVASG